MDSNKEAGLFFWSFVAANVVMLTYLLYELSKGGMDARSWQFSILMLYAAFIFPIMFFFWIAIVEMAAHKMLDFVCGMLKKGK